MILQQTKPKPKYNPATLTLETQEEFFLVMRLLGGVSTGTVSELFDYYYDHCDMYFLMKDAYTSQGLEQVSDNTFCITVKEKENNGN